MTGRCMWTVDLGACAVCVQLDVWFGSGKVAGMTAVAILLRFERAGLQGTQGVGRGGCKWPHLDRCAALAAAKHHRACSSGRAALLRRVYAVCGLEGNMRHPVLRRAGMCVQAYLPPQHGPRAWCSQRAVRAGAAVLEGVAALGDRVVTATLPMHQRARTPLAQTMRAPRWLRELREKSRGRAC